MSVVLVAEDAFVRNGIRSILGNEPSVRIAGEAANVGQACRLGSQLEPGLFVVDMPAVTDRDTLLGQVRRLAASGQGGSASVLVLGSDLRRMDLDVLRLGGCAIIRRQVAAGELAPAVRLLASGYLPVEQSLVQQLAHTAPRLGAVPTLTEREQEVLHLLARGMSNAEIAAELGVAGSTVKSHVQEIFGKLGLRNRVQAVIYAYESRGAAPVAARRMGA
ncbi:LuxR C-terminal-related transcriptional regulator [Kitasatospora sp. DSM 101779]|uniref:LuxR C-terminal-related transcriptional regulator n=1 Tax=Kitasatospora sp. DSM 101779 TaxID=2853165 RepID=UPI0021D85382|nr:response regulator transcription factor [Kitasatospora sp. DSM 101779]